MEESVNYVLEKYSKGQRYFTGIDLDSGSFDCQVLEIIIFEYCSLYVSFRKANLRNAKFINGGIKTCDFREADLSGATFENVCIEGAQFARAKREGIIFNNNSAYSQRVTQEEFEEWIKDHEE